MKDELTNISIALQSYCEEWKRGEIDTNHSNFQFPELGSNSPPLIVEIYNSQRKPPTSLCYGEKWNSLQDVIACGRKIRSGSMSLRGYIFNDSHLNDSVDGSYRDALLEATQTDALQRAFKVRFSECYMVHGDNRRKSCVFLDLFQIIKKHDENRSIDDWFWGKNENIYDLELMTIILKYGEQK